MQIGNPAAELLASFGRGKSPLRGHCGSCLQRVRGFDRHCLSIAPRTKQIQCRIDRGALKIALEMGDAAGSDVAARQPQEDRLRDVFGVCHAPGHPVSGLEDTCMMRPKNRLKLPSRLGHHEVFYRGCQAPLLAVPYLRRDSRRTYFPSVAGKSPS